MMNVVALRGELSRPAEQRVLPTGSSLVAFEVTTRRDGAERADTVPVVWHDAPASASNLDGGDEVVVVGHVARRFFRAGGATQSRTEVVASAVIPIRSAKRIDAALREAATHIKAALPARAK
jgi:single-strand DNA-binding protein